MMLEIFYSTKFKRDVKKLPLQIKAVLVQKGDLFEKDPFHPTLRTHKLAGGSKGFWAFSLDYRHRVVFEFISTHKVILHSVGDHSVYHKK